MKENYEKLKMEIIVFLSAEVITASGDDGGGDWGEPDIPGL